MIDSLILPLQARILRPLAQSLAKTGIRADHLTLAGCAIGVAAACAAAMSLYGVALAGVVLNRLMDGLDGAVARLTTPTDRGAFLDIALDFVFYTAFPLGFVIANPDINALPGAVLIASFVLSGTSFLAFSTIAAKRGITAADYPQKGIYYLGGLTEGFETIAFFIVICLFPGAFAWLAYGFATACVITAAIRYKAGWDLFD